MSVPREIVRKSLNRFTSLWKPYSRLFMVSDSAFWVISWEMKEVGHIAQKLGKRLAPTWLLPFTDRQSVFFGSHFDLFLRGDWFTNTHRLGTAYFHGKPGTGIPEFDTCYEKLHRHHELIQAVQVSCSPMEEIVLSSGILPEKVHRIPIGINLNFFPKRTPEMTLDARRKLGLPDNAVIVGSFQKDGVGWEEGFEPKMVKGPDVFVETMNLLREKIPSLHVLLAGPARGYVKRRLAELGIPYTYRFLNHYPSIKELYYSLDAYVVSSREEGGPKAVLESMACGVPLITTRVGQAVDLVRHGENGWMVDVADVEALAYWTTHVIERREHVRPVLEKARQTAENNCYEKQIDLWRKLFQNLIM